jgi:hypothetical protein
VGTGHTDGLTGAEWLGRLVGPVGLGDGPSPYVMNNVPYICIYTNIYIYTNTILWIVGLDI